MMLFLITLIFGAVVGSFLNVCIARIPKGQSIIHPPSHCPNCQASIPFYCNVPLLRYVWLWGRCRSCKEPISSRYPIVELLTALVSLALMHRFGPSYAFFVTFLFAAALIVISFIDLDVRIVPDVISLPGIVLGLVLAIIGYFIFDGATSFIPSPLSSLIGILAGGGFLLATAWIYEKITGVEGMGGGDIKLLAMIGAFLGWPSVPVTLFFASLVGSVVGLACMLMTGAGRRLALPFAPFLCSGAVLFIFYGEELIRFYLPPG